MLIIHGMKFSIYGKYAEFNLAYVVNMRNAQTFEYLGKFEDKIEHTLDA